MVPAGPAAANTRGLRAHLPLRSSNPPSHAAPRNPLHPPARPPARPTCFPSRSGFHCQQVSSPNACAAAMSVAHTCRGAHTGLVRQGAMCSSSSLVGGPAPALLAPAATAPQPRPHRPPPPHRPPLALPLSPTSLQRAASSALHSGSPSAGPAPLLLGAPSATGDGEASVPRGAAAGEASTGARIAPAGVWAAGAACVGHGAGWG